MVLGKRKASPFAKASGDEPSEVLAKEGANRKTQSQNKKFYSLALHFSSQVFM